MRLSLTWEAERENWPLLCSDRAGGRACREQLFRQLCICLIYAPLADLVGGTRELAAAVFRSCGRAGVPRTTVPSTGPLSRQCFSRRSASGRSSPDQAVSLRES